MGTLNSPRVLAVLNTKGGSGKTTTAVSLAATLAERHRSVLLVDCDPAGAATWWLGVAAERGLYDVLLGGLPPADGVVPTATNGVDLVPATPALARAEVELRDRLALRKALDGLDPGRWRYVLLDAPPSLTALSVGAMAAARELLVPVECHVLALNGLRQLFQAVDLARKQLNPELSVAGLLGCRVNRTRHSRAVLEELRRHFGDQVLQTTVRESTRLAEAPSFRRPITVHDPEGHGAEDYRNLAAEIIRQERKA